PAPAPKTPVPPSPNAAPPAPKKPRAGAYLPLLKKFREQLPHVNIPAALDKTWIEITEVVIENGKEAVKWVYFKTAGLDPRNGRPKTLGGGASSEVYPITAVLDRETTTMDRSRGVTGDILAKATGNTDGTVLKINKDHLQLDRHGNPEPGFGNAH